MLNFFWEWAESSAGTRKTRGRAKFLILRVDLRDSPRSWRKTRSRIGHRLRADGGRRSVMDLEFHQVDLRYEALRTRNAAREARLLASLVEKGQQAPVVVVTVGDAGRHVLVDGYKRVRALRRLGRDTVRAMAWDLGEAEALVVERLMRSGDGAGALEEGWLLAELRDRFGMTVEELGLSLIHI